MSLLAIAGRLVDKHVNNAFIPQSTIKFILYLKITFTPET